MRIVNDMNEKEIINLKYYKDKIEKRKFNEYDVIGFLVLIREHVDIASNPIFHDFANGTAHRKRNQGIIYDCMYHAELNCYNLDNQGKIINSKVDSYGNQILVEINANSKVVGYSGIPYEKWIEECNNISSLFDIKITPIIAKELLVCMFSIFHRSIIETDSKSRNNKVSIFGSLELDVGSSDSLSLLTSDDIKKYTVCFMKIENITVLKNDFIMKSVETFRKKGILYLRDEDDIILKVSKFR